MAGKERLEDGRMVIRHPSGKVELVASEQERLAQLGARVLAEIAERSMGRRQGLRGQPLYDGLARDGFFSVIEAARSLGLLEEGGSK